jgi:hypothetical protein
VQSWDSLDMFLHHGPLSGMAYTCELEIGYSYTSGRSEARRGSRTCVQARTQIVRIVYWTVSLSVRSLVQCTCWRPLAQALAIAGFRVLCKLRKKQSLFMLSPFALFIASCVVNDTLFAAVDLHDPTPDPPRGVHLSVE